MLLTPVMLPVSGPYVYNNTWSSSVIANYPFGFQYMSNLVLLGDSSVLGVGGRNSSNVGSANCYRYLLSNNTWIPAATYPFPVSGNGLVSLNDGRALSIGGYNENIAAAVKNTYIYSVTSNTWTQVNSCPTEISWGGAGVLSNGSVIVFGGFGNNDYQTETFRFDPGANTWTDVLSSFPTTGGFYMSSCSANNVIFDIGHYYYGQPWPYNYIYSPNSWSNIPDYPIAAGICALGIAAMANGSVLTVGGYTNTMTNNCYRYDLGANTWTRVANYPISVDWVACVKLPNNAILCAGGAFANGTVTSNCYVYT